MSAVLRKKTCEACGEPHWFRHWVGQFCENSAQGLNVLDFDLVFHRYREPRDKLGCRKVEHLMVVEVKIANEQLRDNQRDTLSLLGGLLEVGLQKVEGEPINVASRPGFIRPGDKKVVWHGVHLLRVPFRRSNIGPFFWDNRKIDSNTLIKVLNFANDPHRDRVNKKLDIDRRHKARCEEITSPDHLLFSI